MAQKSTPKASRATPPVVEEPKPPIPEKLADFMSHFARFFWDIAGILCLTLALMTLLVLAAPSWTSGLLTAWGELVRDWLGWGAYWIVLLIGLLGVWIFRRNTVSSPANFWGSFVLLELAAFSSLGLLAALGGIDVLRAEARMDGGRLGWGLAELVRRLLEPLGLTDLIWIDLLFGGLLIFFLIAGLSLTRPVSTWLRRATHPAVQAQPELAVTASGVVESPLPSANTRTPAAAHRKPAQLPPQFRKNFRLAPEAPASPGDLPSRSERLPPMEILVYEQYNRPDERTINQTAGLIEKTLADFGIPARVIDFRVGPTVTQFAVEPGYLEKEKPATEGEAAARQKVRVAQISSLARDLSLAFPPSGCALKRLSPDALMWVSRCLIRGPRLCGYDRWVRVIRIG